MSATWIEIALSCAWSLQASTTVGCKEFLPSCNLMMMMMCVAWTQEDSNIGLVLSLVQVAERSRAGVWVCWSAPLVRVRTCSWPMWKRDFRRVQKTRSNRVMGYRVCQLILCHNNILIIGDGEWQCLRINSWGRLNSVKKNWRIFCSKWLWDMG